MFTKEKINAVTTVLGLAVVISTTLSANGWINEKVGKTISGLATGVIGVLVCADKSQLVSTIEASTKLSTAAPTTFSAESSEA